LKNASAITKAFLRQFFYYVVKKKEMSENSQWETKKKLDRGTTTFQRSLLQPAAKASVSSPAPREDPVAGAG
jgi:hypothetical protein